MNKKVLKDKIIKVTGTVVFLAVLYFVFTCVTNLYRNNEFAEEDKVTVAGIKEEAPLDMIYIGGSAAYCYWEPLKAFRETGMVSYDLAVNSIQAEAVLPLVKYAEKYQDPELYVIGIRSFQYYKTEGDEYYLRNTTDCMDNGYNRFKLISDYLKDRDLDVDELSLYLDIIEYHTNPYALAYETNWKLIDNSIKCDFKGGQPKMGHSVLKRPVDFQTDERAELIERDAEILNELIDYLEEHGKKALFIVCPYAITQEEYKIYNSLGDIITNRGYDFLNANDYYDEMNLDFATDFLETSHVNPLGSEKYTAWLEDYIMQHYNLPDHRGDAVYSEWETLSEEYVQTGIDRRNEILDMIAKEANLAN